MTTRIIRRALIAATAVAAFTGAGAAAFAPAASANVLISYDGGTIHVGQDIHPAVWYQSFSGGSRRYWVGVYNPKHRLIWHRHGRASASGWKTWSVLAQKPGDYRTLYITDGTRTHFTTKVKAAPPVVKVTTTTSVSDPVQVLLGIPVTLTATVNGPVITRIHAVD